MSVYALHKILHRAQVDLDFRELVRTDPRATIAEPSSPTISARRVLAGDVVWLGSARECTPSCSHGLPRFALLGLDRDEYNRKMREGLVTGGT